MNPYRVARTRDQRFAVPTGARRTEAGSAEAHRRSVERTCVTPPRVSVGVPVYNGERYVHATLEALRQQTFGDFEVIISDNGSTDRTEQICRRFVERDGRFRYHRSATNQGLVRNFNRCVELARGDYFRWNAADDTCAPTLLEKLVGVLDGDPGVVLAFCRSLIIDEAGRHLGVQTYNAEADDPRPHVRLGRLINIDHRKHCAQEVYGLIRTAALRRTPIYEPVVRADSILLARLALLGHFRCVDEPLFYNREHEARSVRLAPGVKAAARTRLARWIGSGPVPPVEFWNPGMTGRIAFPEWRILKEYWRAPADAALPLAQCASCRLTVLRFALRHTKKLVRDVLIAAEHLVLGRPGPRPSAGMSAVMDANVGLASS